MAKRQDKLAAILTEGGRKVRLPPQRNILSESEYNNSIRNIYKKLGGILQQYPVNFGSFDIELDSCYIELDEENHFTLYRKITLESDFYKNYKYFSVKDYKNFCENKEKKSGKSGGFWTNKSSEAQFGKSSKGDEFSGNGSARWKQRAFYDFLKDVYGSIINKPVYRFSIYEVVGNNSINKILSNNILTEELFTFVSNKIN